jgi:hypothetical protein
MHFLGLLIPQHCVHNKVYVFRVGDTSARVEGLCIFDLDKMAVEVPCDNLAGQIEEEFHTHQDK